MIKILLLAGIAALLSGCYVPGTYFSEDEINKGYAHGGQRQNINITELNSKWLSQHNKQPMEPYKVGPYDILNIIVWDHPELTTPTTQLANPEDSGILVDDDGTIYFPFAGKVKVSGLTMDEIRAYLQKKLEIYIRNPQLSVRVITFRSQEVEVVGEVNKQGLLFITDRHLTAMEAINTSGGVNPVTANTKQIFILSKNNDEIDIHWFDAQNPAALLAAERFRLQKGSIVYIPPAGVSAWNRVITQIIPTLGGVSSSKSVADIE